MRKLFLCLFVALFSVIALPALAVSADGYTMTAPVAVDFDGATDALSAEKPSVAIDSPQAETSERLCRYSAGLLLIAYTGHPSAANAPIDPGRSV